jgi:hypothetical protein
MPSANRHGSLPGHADRDRTALIATQLVGQASADSRIAFPQLFVWWVDAEFVE